MEKDEMLGGDVFAERVFKILDLYEANEIDRIQLLCKFVEMYAPVLNKAMAMPQKDDLVETELGEFTCGIFSGVSIYTKHHSTIKPELIKDEFKKWRVQLAEQAVQHYKNDNGIE